ncbi:M3 family oligoendopeptidase [Geobacter sp. DSM 9736]|uniref:M3 family oligoendopeptidase n=1 Tax=Geobacter sp. DSM 9736 TaxID=1277350 RepID=UPI000B611B9C|nr:M3 family oligoendopeptidase [Geobacter sp. DSM 9736]SNB46076.1 oligoendopeptidase F [Geobacter sp. DSM 9736]
MIGTEIPLTWNTTPLYPSPQSPELEKAFADAAAAAGAFREKYASRITRLDATGLLAALQEYERLQETVAKPQLYAYLLFAADSEDSFNKKLSQRASEFGNLMTRELLFFDLEIMEISETEFAALLADGCLENYSYFLESVRKFRPHTLSEREEQLLKLKSMTGTETLTRLFDELSASFRYRMEMEGEERDFTGEELLGLLHHQDPGVRERSFSVFLRRHEENGITFGTILNTIALDHANELELRNYRHPMEPTNIGNDLPEEIVNRLMSVSEDNYPLAREYFLLKADLLKLPRLKNTDIYAPVAQTDRRFTFDESRKLVLAAYDLFNPEFREIIERFFTEGRIDAMPRTGKSGGAFCMGMTPSLSPYVLLNFTGNLRDVATMAHELGHGLHFVLAQEQTMLNYHAPLPLAETASVFGEMLLTRYLLEKEADKSIKIALLCAKIEDIIATTFRQNVLTRFEERVHLERKEGLLTSERICELWWEENGKLYGNSVDMIEPYRWGWSYISHFIHTRFYCYSYTFAELLVLSLYRSYLEQGAAFIPTYQGILRSGNSRSPAETLQPAGIDLADHAFWQKGYDFLKDLISQLRQLL